MSVLRVLQLLLALYATFWSLYVLLITAAARLRKQRHLPSASGGFPTVAVIVPAHDMAADVVDCIAAIRASEYPQNCYGVYVIADHCADNTAARASSVGAKVLVRSEGPPGKTYAIAWALDRLAELSVDPDLFVVTDATARLDRTFLPALVQKWRTGEDVVVGHSIVSTAHMKWFVRCLGLTLVHRNLQNWSRERLGLSSLIEGRGMAYSRAYVRKFGWSLALPTRTAAGQHPTEDWRHGVRVVESGLRVAYEERAKVYTPLRDNLAAATRQGIRWERGRQLNALTHGLKLLGDALAKHDRLRLFAALDSIQLPVAILAVFCIASAAATWAIGSTAPAARVLGYAPLLLIGLYGMLVTMRGRAVGISPITVIWAPIYVIWRLSAFVLAWVSTGVSNRRTK